ncbi:MULTISPECIES: TA system VapC family ribonuclease toxin [unclassified Novosphingobium]|uniref:TA system VapC family ribonuclease toxin n=1 Tax=unclassified Novosphingobium TaxID=2644732 RepID=UPI0006C8A047|nr:TA system VapC family ribonuclease toxin [Novosphingobium sp. ST904]KPH66680.1 DNA-binding protein [Novosphingobium sp. ST904]TCM26157.1 hypothetical protein EDF59_1365 [Novosphingobium sp. ST904]
MTYLPDVNVLVALIDPAHVGHEAAHAWFAGTGRRNWATCPLTQNGVIRIIGNPRYPNSAGSPAEASEIMRRLCALDGHQFWGDTVNLLECDFVDTGEIRTSAQLTDTYLLALAMTHQGKLATFDRKLSLRPVRGGRKALHLIDGAGGRDVGAV